MGGEDGLVRSFDAGGQEKVPGTSANRQNGAIVRTSETATGGLFQAIADSLKHGLLIGELAGL